MDLRRFAGSDALRAGPQAAGWRFHCLVPRAVWHIEPTLFACERHGDADCRPGEDLSGSTPAAAHTTPTAPALVLCARQNLIRKIPPSRDVPEGASFLLYLLFKFSISFLYCF